MIEEHDEQLAALFGKRRAPRPKLRPIAGEAPEGVALYQCRQLVPHDDGVQAGLHPCGKGLEHKPYAPIPYHCDMPMALVGYDWGRDVADD